ncbi:MAG: anti-sigma regulatory factor [Prochloraceae cyanobacterium]|nr:anti-sigma regulatory factor [Prochloraceae cyanobacterium]
MKIKSSLNFKVKSNLNALDLVIDSFSQIDKITIPKKDWLQCQLALVEAFTNAVRHAHKDLSQETEIEIKITLVEGCLEIYIWDYGPPFDLQAYLKNLSHQKPNNWAEGGRGIPILHKIADRLDYIRDENNRNCLSIIKYFSPIQENLADERN